jgi:DNA (cytosine-5)-methyltransferase 1
MLALAPQSEGPEWIEAVGELLRPRVDDSSPLVLDLFAGCGGLALGFEAAGFATVGYEMAAQASSTYRSNLSGDCHTVRLDVGQTFPRADIIIGGPPCQPFSVNGDQNGNKDSRDGFPIFLDAVEQLKPKLAIIENVKGMLFRNKLYLHSVVKRLEGMGYNVEARLLNAKDYGVPQNRERLFIVASQGRWAWPAVQQTLPTTVGEALGSLLTDIPAKAKWLNEKHDKYIAVYEKKSQCRPRDLDPNRPSRTVTCRNLYAMTGDMLRIKLGDGRRRMLSVREAARLQSFPDWFEFEGAETRQLEMIGNAVPPLLGLAVARQAKSFLQGSASPYDHLDLVSG